MKPFKSTPYKIVLLLLFANNFPLFAARPSAFNSDLPILYAAIAGLLFLIVEFRKVLNVLKSFTYRIVNLGKK